MPHARPRPHRLARHCSVPRRGSGSGGRLPAPPRHRLTGWPSLVGWEHGPHSSPLRLPGPARHRRRRCRPARAASPARPAARRRRGGRRGAPLPAVGAAPRRPRHPRRRASRSSSSPARCRCRVRPTTRARRRSPPSSTSSSGSACPPSRQTIVIAGGLERRAGRRELEAVLRPIRRARLPGRGCRPRRQSPDLRPLELQGAPPVRIHGALLDTDLVVCVTAAETSERGGACALLGACAAEDDRLRRGRHRRCSRRRSPRPASSRARSRPRSRAGPPSPASRSCSTIPA